MGCFSTLMKGFRANFLSFMGKILKHRNKTQFPEWTLHSRLGKKCHQRLFSYHSPMHIPWKNPFIFSFIARLLGD